MGRPERYLNGSWTGACSTRLDHVRPAAFAAQYDLIIVKPDGGGLSEADARCDYS